MCLKCSYSTSTGNSNLVIYYTASLKLLYLGCVHYCKTEEAQVFPLHCIYYMNSAILALYFS